MQRTPGGVVVFSSDLFRVAVEEYARLRDTAEEAQPKCGKRKG